MFSTPVLRLCRRSVVVLCSAGAKLGPSPGASPTHLSRRPFPRLHGTVTGYKHRRGYGFILAEGVVGSTPPAGSVAELMTGYFFTRNGLQGGHYVTEGERVSFDVQLRRREKGHESKARSLGYVPIEGEAALVDDASASLATPSTAAAITGAGAREAQGVEEAGEASASLNLAVNIQMYDLKTGVETPVEPIGLRGKVIQWDAVQGIGLVGELDTEGNYHADAPRFFLCLDDADLGPQAELRVGRYVRFCLENDSDGAEESIAAASAGDAEVSERPGHRPQNTTGLPVARRVIVDRTMEHRMAVVGRPLAPAGAPPGSVTARSRFEGTIRDINANFGFVTDAISGESIFFHASNVSSRGLVSGDRVTYMLRELTRGKHVGKKACFDVRRARAPRRESVEEEFDLLDEEVGSETDGSVGESSAGSVGSGRTSAASGRKGKSGKRNATGRRPRGSDDDDEFDLLD